MKRKIISVLLVFILILAMLTTSFAYTQSDINKVENQKAETKKEYNKVKAEKDSVLNEISDLEDSISEYESEISTLNTKIEKLETQIEDKGEEIEELKQEFEDMQELLTDRLVAIYEEGQVTFLDVLLSAESVWDYISMPTRIEELTEADNEQMEGVEKQRQEVEKAQKELEEQNTELTNTKKSVEAKQAQLKVVKAEKETKAANLTKEQKELQSKIDDYNKEIKKMENAIAAAAQNSSGHYQGSFSGILSWPLSSSSPNYNYITSYYGNRVVPVAGATANHNGIDIGVYSGTPVYSAADGYVAGTGYNSARGYWVMIKHADNLYTFYQHLNSYVVSTGKNVKRGQLIAYSGNTGISSGPHLHFEVRTGPGDWDLVDPLDYVHW